MNDEGQSLVDKRKKGIVLAQLVSSLRSFPSLPFVLIVYVISSSLERPFSGANLSGLEEL